MYLMPGNALDIAVMESIGPGDAFKMGILGSVEKRRDGDHNGPPTVLSDRSSHRGLEVTLLLYLGDLTPHREPVQLRKDLPPKAPVL
ncbi:unnamed protein product [Boreogadus saida]